MLLSSQPLLDVFFKIKEYNIAMFRLGHLSKWDKLLAADFVLLFLLNLFWIVQNNALYSADQSAQAAIALKLAYLIKSGHFLDILSASSYYPIFAHLIASIVILIFGPQLKFIQITSTFFSIATFFIIYKYFSLITKSPKVALISVVIFSLFPVIFDNSHWLMLDIPMTGAFFLSLYFLEKSKNLTVYKYCILFFVSVGALLMTKWTGAALIAFPIFWTFVQLLRKHQSPNMRGVLIGILFFLIITLPWYITNLATFLFQAKFLYLGVSPAFDTAVNASIFSALAYYPKTFINIQANFFIALSFIITIPIFLKGKTERKWYILASIVYGYAFFTLIPDKIPRYPIPYLPFTTLPIAIVLGKLKNRKLSNAFCLGLVSISFLYLSLLDFRPNQIENYRLRIPNTQIFIADVSNQVVKKYDPNDWQLSNIVRDIEARYGGRQVTIEFGLTYPHFNIYVLRLYLFSKQYEGEFTNLITREPQTFYLKPTASGYIFPNQESIKAYLQDKNFVLLSQENMESQMRVPNHPAIIQLKNYILKNYKVKERKDYTLPNGSVENLYFF